MAKKIYTKKQQARRNARANIKAAGSDGVITNREAKRIAKKSNLGTKQVAKLIRKSDAKSSADVGYQINRDNLSVKDFNAKKEKLKNSFMNVATRKDPYTGGTNQDRLDKISNKLGNYGVNNFNPSELAKYFHKQGKRGGDIRQGRLEKIVSNNPQHQANYIASLARKAGVGLRGGDDITARMIRGIRNPKEVEGTGAGVQAPLGPDQTVTGMHDYINNVTQKILETFGNNDNRIDFGSLFAGMNQSNAAIAQGMNASNAAIMGQATGVMQDAIKEGQVQMSQMNPMRMSPVLGIRSAGMQNYGLNNATNTFGRDGTRFGNLTNNQLNLS